MSNKDSADQQNRRSLFLFMKLWISAHQLITVVTKPQSGIPIIGLNLLHFEPECSGMVHMLSVAELVYYYAVYHLRGCEH